MRLPALVAVLTLWACDDGSRRGAPGSAANEVDAPAADAGPADSVSDAPSDPAAAERAELRAVCDTLRNSFECARAIEARQLPRTDRVVRQGDTLRLALADGDTLRLVDEGERADVTAYSYQDHWPGPGTFLLQVQFYEGSAYLLIDERTGERTRLPDWPLPSPDGRRFAVLSFDLEAGYSPNTLQVWEFEDGEPELEWDTEPDDWGPTDGEWTNATTLRFTQRGYCEDPGADTARGMCDRPARLTLREGTWQLESSP